MKLDLDELECKARPCLAASADPWETIDDLTAVAARIAELRMDARRWNYGPPTSERWLASIADKLEVLVREMSQLITTAIGGVPFAV